MNTKIYLLYFLTLALGLISCGSKTQNNVTDKPIPLEEVEEDNESSIAVNKRDTSSEYHITKTWVLGHFDPSDRDDFVMIDIQYADREGLFLHQDSYSAFLKMWTAARADHVELQIRSATRNHEYQQGIWERKWTGNTLLEGKTNAAKEILDPKERCKAILRYSSMPGSSRHHWGTDIDLNAFENEYFEPGGEGERVYNWLQKNAKSYGFCQVYSDKNTEQRTGYEEEKWHWSYMPLAQQLDHYVSEYITDDDVNGFLGADHSSDVQIVNNYMQGISKHCRNFTN